MPGNIYWHIKFCSEIYDFVMSSVMLHITRYNRGIGHSFCRYCLAIHHVASAIWLPIFLFVMWLPVLPLSDNTLLFSCSFVQGASRKPVGAHGCWGNCFRKEEGSCHCLCPGGMSSARQAGSTEKSHSWYMYMLGQFSLSNKATLLSGNCGHVREVTFGENEKLIYS